MVSNLQDFPPSQKSSEANFDRQFPYANHVPEEAKNKINTVFQNTHNNKNEGFTPSSLLAPLFGIFYIGSVAKRNRDAHLNNENTSIGTSTINPNRQKMGIGERLGLVPIEKKQDIINGAPVEVTFYPRMGQKSIAEITSGPSELVGMTLENLNCHQPDWQENAIHALQNKTEQNLPSKQTNPRTLDPKPQSQPVAPPPQPVAPPPQPVAPPPQPVAPPPQPVAPPPQPVAPLPQPVPPKPESSTNNSSSEAKGIINYTLNLFGVKDKTQNQQIDEANQKIQLTRGLKVKIKENPSATLDQVNQANSEFFNAFEERIRLGGDLMPANPGFKAATINHLESLEFKAKLKADAGKKLLHQAEGLTQNSHVHNNKAKVLQKHLDQNPNASEITQKLPDGTSKTISRKKTAQKIDKLNQKGSTLTRKATQLNQEGAKKAPVNRAKEKAAGETVNQVKNFGATVANSGLSHGADALVDVLTGECDVKTAVCNTVVNTVASTAIQMSSSIAYEALKGGVTDLCPDLAKSLPGLGTAMTILNVGQTFSSASTTAEGLEMVGRMGANMGGEMATVAALTAIVGFVGVSTGPVAIPLAIGGKYAWRSMKYGYYYVLSPCNSSQ